MRFDGGPSMLDAFPTSRRVCTGEHIVACVDSRWCVQASLGMTQLLERLRWSRLELHVGKGGAVTVAANARTSLEHVWRGERLERPPTPMSTPLLH